MIRLSARLKNHFGPLLLLTCSIAFSLMIGEAFFRIVLDPADYLQVYVSADDEILGHKISPSTLGYDRWGFRNKSVPNSAKIVTIGDSQTYGTSGAKNSWPMKLQMLRNEEVYNLSLGGYGPVQYYHLLKTKALELRPSLVVVGFYFGNDLFDAHNIVYTKEYWRSLRRSDFDLKNDHGAHTNNFPSSQRWKVMSSLRDWLAHRSVLYTTFTLSFGDLFRFVEIKYGSSQRNNHITILDDRERRIHTGFTPGLRLAVLNLGDPKVREGLRLTLELFRQMNDLCFNKSIDFVVVLIPTKESVFAEYIGKNGNLNNSDVIRRVLANEQQINQLMKNYFDEHSISYVDVLPDLMNAAPHVIPYPANEDGHPNAAGYEVIAKGVARFLTTKGFKPNAWAE
jgi:lysophospholipase L1-like esterase